ncbi:MAG: Rho termination factor N-terminal domain-containing protein [Acholeplasmatales bacterium]|nr:Rho termination factor N-terminal domain-containing protein [Acholeplasmataceae bacterium]MCK9427915.1 Rho termination factor N-terminal domain-containing protein [Acholeplasmataceae bacterium]MDY0115264.1 Rho termination factor N-terminal domain-containing protein [Acholeplasmatales bacterium]
MKVESVDYSAYTVSELREIAKDNELSGYSSLKKAELIEFLEKNVEDK